jgi:hypothetical protein
MKRKPAIAFILAGALCIFLWWSFRKGAIYSSVVPPIAFGHVISTGTNKVLHLLLKNANQSIFLVEVFSNAQANITNVDLELREERRIEIPPQTVDETHGFRILGKQQRPEQLKSWDEALIRLGLRRRRFAIFAEEPLIIPIIRTNSEP